MKYTLTEEIEFMFRTINSKGWRKPKIVPQNSFWRRQPKERRKK